MSAIYQKREVLGWGGLATVFKGWDELLDRPVAVKELVQPFAGHEAFVRAFVAQGLRMVDISHRHVLATYAVETDRTAPAVLRELADETLGHQLLEGAIAPEAVLRILRHVLAGLDVIHGRELLHRAVKPENIFVCGDVYKIGDFGIPAIEGGPTFPPRRLKYTAPEILVGSEEVGPASDLYSLGLVIHELLLGSVRLEQTLEQVLQRSGASLGDTFDDDAGSDEFWPAFNRSPVEIPPLHELETSIPVAFSLTLQRMVRKSQSERYGSCREVLAALGAGGLVEVFGGSQSLTVPASALQPPRIVSVARAPQRSPRPLWLGGGIALAFLTAGGAWFGAHFGRQDLTPLRAHISGSETPGADAQASSLESALFSLRSDGGLSLALDPAPAGGHARLAVKSPLSFRVTSDRSAHLALFGLSADGMITCLYPDAARPVLQLRRKGSLLLPTLEDRRNGFVLIASPPLGRQLVFVLASDLPLPPLPEGNVTSPWLTEYAVVPAGSRGSARLFVDWVTGLRRERAEGTRLTVLEIDVVPGP